MSEELKKLADIIDHRPTRFYHSVLDPEAKVVVEEPGGIIHIRDKQIWKDFVSNTWLSPQQIRDVKAKSKAKAKVKVKPRGSARIDYKKNNYCASCELKHQKTEFRCRDCNRRLRTKPWHGRSNFANGGRY